MIFSLQLIIVVVSLRPFESFLICYFYRILSSTVRAIKVKCASVATLQFVSLCHVSVTFSFVFSCANPVALLCLLFSTLFVQFHHYAVPAVGQEEDMV